MEDSYSPDQNNSGSKKRRSGVGWALIYVAFLIGVSFILATVGWFLASDMLALNKDEVSVEITLPGEVFEVTETQVAATDDDGKPVLDENGDPVMETVTIRKADMGYVAEQLQENGLIKYKWLFRLFAALTNGNEKLYPGTYMIDSNMDFRAIITNLGSSSASRATVSVTFVEGSTVDQVFEQMEESGVASVEDLQNMAATHDYAFSFLENIELGDYHRLEGYLFPDTYTFYLEEDPKTAINKMLVNFDARMTDELRETITESGYTMHEIITIASMIEKETDGSDETTIASVIYNRLERATSETAGYLNIDATIHYVTGEAVTAEDIQTVDSPYNTYLNKGLPPGPIANPGMESILAALNPDDTGYYYYVLNPNTNLHEFSKTYSGHQALISEYAGG